jgi:hypothetical protein
MSQRIPELIEVLFEIPLSYEKGTLQVGFNAQAELVARFSFDHEEARGVIDVTETPWGVAFNTDDHGLESRQTLGQIDLFYRAPAGASELEPPVSRVILYAPAITEDPLLTWTPALKGTLLYLERRPDEIAEDWPYKAEYYFKVNG